MTESKKLQTTYTGHGSLGNLTDSAVIHDLFIAHEQREVIADLHWALEAFLSYERHGKRGGTRAFSKANAEKLTAILSAAAPFLED